MAQAKPINGKLVVKEFQSEGDNFALFLNDLLTSHAENLSVSGLHLTSGTNLPDGGVDAQVDGANPDDPLGWFTAPAIWQYKAGKADSKLLAKLKQEVQVNYARTCLEQGYGYCLVVCDYFTPKRLANWQTVLGQATRQVNPAAPPIVIVGADDLAAALNRYPYLASRYFEREATATFDEQAVRAEYLSFLRTASQHLDLRGILPNQANLLLPIKAAYFPLWVAQADKEQTWLSDASLLTQDEQRLTNHYRQMRFSRGQTMLDQLPDKHAQLVILGEPGSGKTTWLRHLTHELAGSGQRLPIYLRIAEYAEAWAKNHSLPLRDYLATAAHAHGSKLAGAALDRLFGLALARGECLVLLDGLDEIAELHSRGAIRDRVEEFSHSYQPLGNHLIVTSRPAGYYAAPLADDYLPYAITPLLHEQIRPFLRQWCRAVERKINPDAANLEERIKLQVEGVVAALQDSGVARLAENPLLLTMLALLHRSGRKLPNRRIELFALATSHLISRWQPNLDRAAQPFLSQAEVVEVLATVAYHLHRDHPSGIITERQVQELVAPILVRSRGLTGSSLGQSMVVNDFLRRVRETTGLFVELAPRRYGFVHLSFEEYYAALLLTTDEDRQLPALARDPRWQEVWLLAVAHLALDDRLLAGGLVVESCLSGDPAVEPDLATEPGLLILALRACAEGAVLSTAAQQGLVASVVALYCEREGQDHTPQLRPQLEQAVQRLADNSVGRALRLAFESRLHEPDDYTRQQAVRGRAGLGGDDLVPLLLRCLTDASGLVRQAAASALGRVGQGNESIQVLLDLVEQDADSKVCQSAAFALNRLKLDAEQANRLLPWLWDQERCWLALTILSGQQLPHPALTAALLELDASGADFNRSFFHSALVAVGDDDERVVRNLLTTASQEGDEAWGDADDAAYKLVYLLLDLDPATRLLDEDEWEQLNASSGGADGWEGEVGEQVIYQQVGEAGIYIHITKSGLLYYTDFQSFFLTGVVLADDSGIKAYYGHQLRGSSDLDTVADGMQSRILDPDAGVRLLAERVLTSLGWQEQAADQATERISSTGAARQGS